MARADAAHASIRSDSIKGLAQSIAKPAYRRLLTAEPVLRRAVPALIVAFLVTVGIAAVIQAYERFNKAIADAIEEVQAGADIVVERLDRSAKDGAFDTTERVQSSFDRAITPRATASGRSVLLIDAAGTIIASTRNTSTMIKSGISDVLARLRAEPGSKAP